MATSKIADATNPGARLALEMLKRLERDDELGNLCQLDPEYRSGKPQRNLVYEYLQRATAHAGGVEGFCAVLTGHIAIATEGALVPDSDFVARQYRANAKARD